MGGDSTMIELIRGDTDIITIEYQREDGEPFIPSDSEDGDKYTFTVRTKDRKIKIMEKTIYHPKMIFSIEENDTLNLPVGEYEYDIEYRKPDNSVVKTLIVDKLILSKDVTY